MGVCVLGSLNLDIVCRVAELPRPGETVIGLGVTRVAGGKGANQAAAAARAGAETRLVGAVGRDEAGAFMLAAMADAGVDTAGVAELDGRSTGQAFIWVSDAGENSIVVDSGANAGLSAAHISLAGVGGGAVFLAQLETPPPTIEALFASDIARAGVRILNAAPAAPEGRRLLPHTDILVLNETELTAYAGLAFIPEAADDIAGAALSLIVHADQTVIVTLGKAGAIAVSRERRMATPGRPARVVDTTGAGDCFCGVLAARLAAGNALETAMRWANVAASLSTERPGATPSVPRWDEIAAAGAA